MWKLRAPRSRRREEADFRPEPHVSPPPHVGGYHFSNTLLGSKSIIACAPTCDTIETIVGSPSADFSTILLVEDEKNDAFFFERALKKAGIVSSFTHLKDGEQAINYLRGAGTYADRSQHPFPSLLITDIKMPGISGFDLLAWIQNEIRLRTFPIIVLSSSVLPEDKAKAFALGADDYWVKPPEMNDLIPMLRDFKAKNRSHNRRIILL